MFFLIYISTITPFTDKQEIVSILDTAQTFNPQVGITGILLYQRGKFMQLLEGEEAPVKELMERIKLDPRHQNIKVLLEAHQEDRHFERWSMAFIDCDLPEIKHNPAYAEVVNTEFTSEDIMAQPWHCQSMLRLFCRAL